VLGLMGTCMSHSLETGLLGSLSADGSMQQLLDSRQQQR